MNSGRNGGRLVSWLELDGRIFLLTVAQGNAWVRTLLLWKSHTL